MFEEKEQEEEEEEEDCLFSDHSQEFPLNDYPTYEYLLFVNQTKARHSSRISNNLHPTSQFRAFQVKLDSKYFLSQKYSSLSSMILAKFTSMKKEHSLHWWLFKIVLIFCVNNKRFRHLTTLDVLKFTCISLSVFVCFWLWFWFWLWL